MEESQREGPKTSLRLYLRASKLPRSLTNQQPNTLARVSLLSRTSSSSSDQLPPPVLPHDAASEEDGSDGGTDNASLVVDASIDETEVRLR